ncbi:hypothetical protein L873DRAFT_1805242 [Choiromyces venosus 120613-1]|uniref:Uncharacterized protein n=1 Tax=Choiromyces venosus 120613-1 TaxID=1336337 RepID=A0A3N4JU92_9PEZI|nr:hypothetical protein L873DRAFT_1805242 [Choiromyces venosus 120613-1]
MSNSLQHVVVERWMRSGLGRNKFFILASKPDSRKGKIYLEIACPSSIAALTFVALNIGFEVP